MNLMLPKNVTHILVHNSDSLWGDVTSIRRWHTDPPPNGNGWSDIAYHFVVCNQFPAHRALVDNKPVLATDGQVQPGRPSNLEGAHEQLYNKRSIGVCLVGKGPTFTPNQMQNVRALTRELMRQYGVPREHVLGHAEVDSNKRDPGFDMAAFRASL